MGRFFKKARQDLQENSSIAQGTAIDRRFVFGMDIACVLNILHEKLASLKYYARREKKRFLPVNFCRRPQVVVELSFFLVNPKPSHAR